MEMAAFDVRVAMIEPGAIFTPIFEKDVDEPDPTSPYLKFYDRLGRILEAGWQYSTTPEAAAAVTQEAVETNSPKLRYLVGNDAHSIVKGRGEMTDEEWIAMGRLSDEEFDVFAREKLGLEL